MFPLAESIFPLAENWFPSAKTMFPLAESIFPLAETAFPLWETIFPLAETAFPLGKIVFPLAESMLGARTNFRFRNMFARGPDHVWARCVYFATILIHTICVPFPKFVSQNFDFQNFADAEPTRNADGYPTRIFENFRAFRNVRILQR